MVWNKKKKTDIVDYASLYKRGIIPKPIPQKNEEGLVDYSKKQEVSSNDNFLNSLASVGNSINLHPSPGELTTGLRKARSKNILESQLSEMKIKLDDSEYKIKILTEKVLELEKRMNNSQRG